MSGYTPIVIHEGIVEGRLVGGNLAVFCATMGSEYFPTLSKKSILILEGPHYSLGVLRSRLLISFILRSIQISLNYPIELIVC
jgi:muramoyltetrapeptide carboxypeptidase LdcA involved in peptidoglycan recycling